MDPATLQFDLILFSIVTGVLGVLAFVKYLSESKHRPLPKPRHPYARG